MKKLLVIILVSVLFIFSPNFPLIASVAIDESINGADYQSFAQELGIMVENENTSINKEYHNDSFFSTSRLIVKSSGLIDTLDAVDVVNGFDGIWILQFENSEKAFEAYNYYRSRNNIDFVEFDSPVSVATVIQNNSTESLSWGTDHINLGVFNQIIKQKEVHTEQTVVAVIDTGIEHTHQFFNGKVVPTQINTSGSGTRNSSKDDNGHGTQVAGVIADAAGDSIIIKPYKVLNNFGHGTIATVAAGIICAINDNVDVINISLGFYENSPLLQLAIKRAYDNDIIIVGAAGNDSTDDPYYPASYPEVLKITAINNENKVANFSNYGDDVAFAAPGVNIYTTHLNNSYIKISGTSIATPFVSALAATIKSLIPNGSPEDVIKVLENNALKPANVYDDKKLGLGIINAPEISDNVATISGKTEPPYFSKSTKIYTEPFSLEIMCDTPDSEIYYSTNGDFPSKYSANTYKYIGPITVCENLILTAVAYSEGKFRSKFTTFMAIVATYPEETSFEIDNNGKITKYLGSETSISIPESIGGVTVKGIGPNAFSSSDIVCVQLPQTATSIDASAFEECTSLRTIIAENVKNIGDFAFYNCKNLTYLHLDSLETIGKYSFYNVCSEINSITGETIKLDVSKLTQIPEGAFSKAAVSELMFSYIYSIGNNAFTDCSQLVSFRMEYAVSLPNNAFSGCSSLKNIEIKGLTFVPRQAFSGCKSLENASFPDVSFVNAFAFENCSSLEFVTLPLAETVYSNAFSGCTSLRLLALPSFKAFEVNSSANGAYPKLPASLETFYAPKLLATVPNMFFNCPQIKNIFLNGTTDLADKTFNGCNSVLYLNIESITQISNDPFYNSTIKFVDGRSIVIAENFPNNSGILLSNKFEKVNNPTNGVTLYSPTGSKIEEYANTNNFTFKSIPFVATQLPHCVNDNSETVFFIPVGFNIKMQWYYNKEMSKENSILLENETTSSLTFNEDFDDGYYYCEIIQEYDGITSKTYTTYILKDTVPADYSAYNDAVDKAKLYNKSLYKDFSEVDAALSVDVSGLYSHRQNEIDAQAQAILTALKNLELNKVTSFRIYAKKSELKVMESTKLNVAVGPANAGYSKITYSVDNPDVLLISDSGFVRCIGSGKATVTAKLTNFDGTVLNARMTFNCKATPASFIFGILFKLLIFLTSSKYI